MNEELNDRGMEQVERALHALREASQSACAPERVEESLRRAFGARQRKRSPKYLWMAAGAMAASLMIAAAVRLSQPSPTKAPDPAVAAGPPASEVRSQVKPETTVTGAAVPVRRARRSPPRRPAAVRSDREVATDFFSIPYTPALTQADRGQVIRVRVPAESMRSFGLPVNEERMFERVHADVLLGEDGIARAIRFVR
jgi:hypothetical protein